MQIAISSQNRKTITGHAGKCRNFWIYTVECGQVKGRHLVELPLEQSFHASHHEFATPLADINVLITDQGTRVSTNVAQQLPMVQVAAGGTNPGGYGRRGGV